MLMWLMDTAVGEERSVTNLARRMLITFTYALYDLAANSQYLQPLREEVEAAVAADGWTKAAVSKMHRVDSFLRESQRMHGLQIAGLRRLALKPFTFSNGVTIPAGTLVSCSTRSTHHDGVYYDHPDVFDAFRFTELSKDEEKKHQMVSVSADYLAFGNGVHACPGRFFAAYELKAMLAHVVVSYDVKFEDGQGIPSDQFVADSCIPGTADIWFRQRR
ncbi:cytochrome P450 [Artomyces pyxidatus]|uniref:Cytochrome P450 n=1 Tax=Artomyces pyxidatus TaxID=48021 RepID=A0ACB8SV18_9AGAM|nr:cytochrome P450 [Artomyces pyxidatus]